MVRRWATLALLLCVAGCVRRDGRNSDCRWPGETPKHPADARHLSADAEFAEDLAIRYADVHHGLRTPYYVSGEAYVAGRERCMATLFEQVAKEHNVDVALVAASLGRNREYVDIGVNLPFVLLYCVAAAVVARWIWRRYPRREYGWIPGAAMALVLSMLLAAACVMFGEVWSSIIETWRIGNGHMSYREQRLLWARYRTELFVGALIVFWMAASVAARRVTSVTDPSVTSPAQWSHGGRGGTG